MPLKSVSIKPEIRNTAIFQKLRDLWTRLPLTEYMMMKQNIPMMKLMMKYLFCSRLYFQPLLIVEKRCNWIILNPKSQFFVEIINCILPLPYTMQHISGLFYSRFALHDLTLHKTRTYSTASSTPQATSSHQLIKTRWWGTFQFHTLVSLMDTCEYDTTQLKFIDTWPLSNYVGMLCCIRKLYIFLIGNFPAGYFFKTCK